MYYLEEQAAEKCITAVYRHCSALDMFWTDSS